MSAKDTLACTTFKTLWVSPGGQAVWATNVLGHDNADAILAALDAAGYAVVPKQPPPSMIIRFMEQTESDAYELAVAMYKAMLTAAKDPT